MTKNFTIAAANVFFHEKCDGINLLKFNRGLAWQLKMITVTKTANSAESTAIPSLARFEVITVQILPRLAPRAID